MFTAMNDIPNGELSNIILIMTRFRYEMKHCICTDKNKKKACKIIVFHQTYFIKKSIYTECIIII